MKVVNKIDCKCGKKHICNIEKVIIEENALNYLEELTKDYKKILIVADNNTYNACKEKLEYFLNLDKVKSCIFNVKGLLIPNEEAIEKIEKNLMDEELIIGIGSGVINDLCKYVSFKHNLPYYIVATSPSMDGYASSGAALIINNMKVTYIAHVPKVIIGDTDILKNAPMEMIISGFGDIIGKFSALNDWKLSKVASNEYFCEYIYNLVNNYLNNIIDLTDNILKREAEAIKLLMEALVIIGIAMSYAENSRPASGSEHHIAHFFELIGILNNEKYLFHGQDVFYGTYLTCKLREEILKLEKIENKFNVEESKNNIKKVFSTSANEIIKLQENKGWINKNLIDIYNNNWEKIKSVLLQAPSSKYIEDLLVKTGLSIEYFEKFYGKDKIKCAIKNSMYLKDRYTVLWMYNTLI